MRYQLIILKNRLLHRSFPDIRLKEILDFETLPLEQKIEVQKQKLTDLLEYAANHTSYYAEILNKFGVVKEGKVDWTRFRQIPFLDKKDIREHFNQLESDQIGKMRVTIDHTGGSTGVPLEFIRDGYYTDCSIALMEQQFMWAGKKRGEIHYRLWGSQEEVMRGSLGLRSTLINWLYNEQILNSFSMSSEQMACYVSRIEKSSTAFIEAYTDSAYELARFINKRGKPLRNISGTIASAGTLYPFMREEIEKAFGCKVTNRYGSREMGGMACEKEPGQGLAVSMFTHFIEIVNENGAPCEPGEEGEIIVTSLTNRAMPFIRYRIGDRAIAGRTSISEPLSCISLASVTGRSVDIFRKKDGGVVSGLYFIHFVGVINYQHWLDKFQVIQSDYNEILIKMVVNSDPPDSDLNRIATDVKRVMGEDCQVKFEKVDEIPREASGKYRFIKSLVK